MSKTIVITGANRGIGFAITKICKERGDIVYALCRQSSPQLSALGVQVIENIDIATEVGISIAKLALANVDIDVLINNAGILRDESLSRFNKTTIAEQFSVNALAPLALTHALLTHLHTGSKVAFITSRMGSITDNTSGGRYGYRMSKAALNSGAMSLARDLATEQIAIGIYHPGYVKTEMVNTAGSTSNGDISADASALKLITLIDNLTMEDSGVFKHSNGEVLPW
jgi:NAD(P)-dependent dehydrogenase (short-subunit alcohol dehydrogenase family)